MNNIGYLFYKEYFKSLKVKNGKPKFDGSLISNKIIRLSLSDYLAMIDVNSSNKKISLSPPVKLKTTYPGLLVGSGYAHEIGGKTAENELTLGFHFDYTTGLPVIPGSSIKGVLRDAFEKADGGYIRYLLKEELKLENISEKLFEKVKVEKKKMSYIVRDIFESIAERKIKDKEEKEVIKAIPKPVYERDIFFDAYPVATANENGIFLANDYITPHKEPLKNPVPLQFLKVLPGVTFRFNFKLQDTTDADENVLLSATDKLELFKRILLDMGVGAKTNVGYGQFTDIRNENGRNEFTSDATLKKLEELQINDIIECEIEKIIYRDNDQKYQVYLKPFIEDYTDFLTKLGKPNPSIRITGALQRQINSLSVIKCKIKRITNDGRVLFSDDILL